MTVVVKNNLFRKNLSISITILMSKVSYTESSYIKSVFIKYVQCFDLIPKSLRRLLDMQPI